MSSVRRHGNPGRREREARKRHRRASLWMSEWGAATEPLKLGREHFGRITRQTLAVADSRKPCGEKAL